MPFFEVFKKAILKLLNNTNNSDLTHIKYSFLTYLINNI